jgi:hypothetical protein
MSEYIRKRYESRLGIPEGAPDELRPVLGYVRNKSNDKKVESSSKRDPNPWSTAPLEEGDISPNGEVTLQGEIEVILKPGISGRTSYMRGDSMETGGRPVAMDSSDTDEILDALIHDDGPESKKNMARTILALLKASLDDDFSGVNALKDKEGRLPPVGKDDPSKDRGHELYEAQILGGFLKEDVQGIHFPYTKVSKMAESLDISDFANQRLFLDRAKRLSPSVEPSLIVAALTEKEPISTPSMQKLREYRTARSIRKKYEKAGIGYIKFSHPEGRNIEDPRNYDKVAKPSDDIETIIKSLIVKELDEMIKSSISRGFGVEGKIKKSEGAKK